MRANVHRSIHPVGDCATNALEFTRSSVQKFIHAAPSEEILFTAGTTASIHRVANSYAQANLQTGDAFWVSHMEHHANNVPWQIISQRTSTPLEVIPITNTG